MEVAEIERALAEPERAVFAYRVHSFAQLTGDDLLKRAKERAPDPSVFDDNPPFFWRVGMSNGRLDSYHTRKMPSTLRNYAREAAEGVSFLIGHDARSEGVGRSLTGRYYAAGDATELAPGDTAEFARVQADIFTLRGYDPRADRLVTRVRAGLSADVSVGFYGGRYICSICAKDMLRDYDCYHIPGVEYVAERNGVKTAERVVAEAHIEDAHLAEISDVYEGATPAAAILKAYRAAQAGQLRPETARLLEARYRVALPAAPRSFAGAEPSIHGFAATTNGGPSYAFVGSLPSVATIAAPTVEPTGTARLTLTGAATHPPTQEADMAEPTTTAIERRETVTVEAADWLALSKALGFERAATLAELGDAAANYRATVDGHQTEAERLTTLTSEVERLRPLAADGERYRADLIDAALTEGVRALGDAFRRDQWAGMLAGMSIEQIRLIHEGWAGKAAERFPGGRLTVDQEERPKAAAPAVRLGAYRGA